MARVGEDGAAVVVKGDGPSLTLLPEDAVALGKWLIDTFGKRPWAAST
jgi:hypothetical protein